jgi:hypothetical protein
MVPVGKYPRGGKSEEKEVLGKRTSSGQILRRNLWGFKNHVHANRVRKTPCDQVWLESRYA